MVRRLIQHFLNWLRQVLAQLRGENNRRPIPPSLRKLPPADEHAPVPGLSTADTATPPLSPPAPPPSPPAPPPSPAPSSRPQPPSNSASSQATNPSNFKVFLSDYHYDPSSAVQSLSNQLANSDNQPSPANDRLNPRIESDGSDGSEQPRIARTSPIGDYPAPLPPPEDQDGPILPPDDGSDVKLSGAESLLVQGREPNNTKRRLALPLPLIESDHPTAVEPTSEPVNLNLAPIPTATESRLGIITKTGVVKLLFKLKKNNHHGYISPDDGSKDIIFHQKYIGNEVFCQLERGMAVEVTAHITEGKAYADCVRIL